MVNVIKLNGVGISFPTKVSEISADVLKELTNRYDLTPHHCIVAICQKSSIFDIIQTINNKKNTTTGVNILLAKANSEIISDKYIGHAVAVDRSSLERGHHVANVSSISSNSVASFFASNTNDDKDFIRSIIQGKGLGAYAESDIDFMQIRTTKVYIVEFKVIFESDIHAIVNDNDVNDMFDCSVEVDSQSQA